MYKIIVELQGVQMRYTFASYAEAAKLFERTGRSLYAYSEERKKYAAERITNKE